MRPSSCDYSFCATETEIGEIAAKSEAQKHKNSRIDSCGRSQILCYYRHVFHTNSASMREVETDRVGATHAHRVQFRCYFCVNEKAHRVPSDCKQNIVALHFDPTFYEHILIESVVIACFRPFFLSFFIHSIGHCWVRIWISPHRKRTHSALCAPCKCMLHQRRRWIVDTVARSRSTVRRERICVSYT